MATYNFSRVETIMRSMKLSVEANSYEEARAVLEQMRYSGQLYDQMESMEDEEVTDASEYITWVDENGFMHSERF